MGLSRNKVAVSEGAAGSPPFYGESESDQRNVEDRFVFGNSAGRKNRTETVSEEKDEMVHKQIASITNFVVQLSVIEKSIIEKQSKSLKWGCSSAGRAPALQAGGHGFDSHHLHQSTDEKRLTR